MVEKQEKGEKREIMKKKYYSTYRKALNNSRAGDVILYDYPDGFYILGKERKI